MLFTPLRLSAAKREQLRVLFLASKAPAPNAPEPGLDPQLGVHPQYNYRLFKALQALNLSVTPCHDLGAFPALLKTHDYVFTIFNRWPMRNSEVFVSSICEFYQVPYLGGPPNVRALAEDKYWTKQLAAQLGIPVPAGKVYREAIHHAPDFPGPYLVKPRFGAASVGIEPNAVQETWADIAPIVAQRLAEGGECLVEQCIPGSDLTLPILGDVTAPALLPCAWEISDLPFGIATFGQKRLLEKGRRRELFPPDHPLQAQVQTYAHQLSALFQPFDYLRADFRLHQDQRNLYLLEVNFGCNLGTHAAIAHSAAAAGLDYLALIEHILTYSLHRQHQSRS